MHTTLYSCTVHVSYSQFAYKETFGLKRKTKTQFVVIHWNFIEDYDVRPRIMCQHIERLKDSHSCFSYIVTLCVSMDKHKTFLQIFSAEKHNDLLRRTHIAKQNVIEFYALLTSQQHANAIIWYSSALIITFVHAFYRGKKYRRVVHIKALIYVEKSWFQIKTKN